LKQAAGSNVTVAEYAVEFESRSEKNSNRSCVRVPLNITLVNE